MRETVEKPVDQGFKAVVKLASASSIDGRELWIDIHRRKHEYGPYLSDLISVELELDGNRLTIRLPDVLRNSRRIEVQAASEAGDLIFLVASHALRAREQHNDEGRGILIAARKQKDGTYAAVIWHEFFPQTLELLGLRPPSVDDLPGVEES